MPEKTIQGGPSHGDTLVVGASGDTVRFGSTASIAAAGSAITDGTAVTATVSTVSAADGTKGIVLPTAAIGKVFMIYNEHATNGLKVYPASASGTINGGSGGAAVTIEGKTLAIFVGTTALNYAAIFTANT